MTLTTTDLHMLANDIGELLAREDYNLNIDDDTILAALPQFLAQISTPTPSIEDSPDAATWTPALDAPETVAPQLRTGRPPRMTYLRWARDQGVELGATDVHEHYWRCPVCRIWAGAYPDPRAAKGIAMDHRYYEHDAPKARATCERKAARYA